MVEYKYWIEINGMIAAKDMTIETALILIKGLYEEYYADDSITITIGRMNDDRW